MGMNLQALEYFAMVAKTQNFTQAADELYISQSTLSKAVQSLETELGVPLFEKQGRGVRITKYGQTLYNQISNNLSALQSVLQEFRIAVNHYRGTVNIGLPIALRSTVLPTVITQFLQQYPEAEIYCTNSHRDSLFNLVQVGDLDFAIVPTAEDNAYPSVYQEFLYMDEICLAVYKEHRLAGYKSVQFNDFKDESFISFFARPHSYNALSIVQELLRERGIQWTPNSRIYVNEPIKFVQSNAGVALLPHTEARLADVLYVPLENIPAFQKYSLIWNPSRKFSPLSNALKAYILYSVCELQTRTEFMP